MGRPTGASHRLALVVRPSTRTGREQTCSRFTHWGFVKTNRLQISCKRIGLDKLLLSSFFISPVQLRQLLVAVRHCVCDKVKLMTRLWKSHYIINVWEIPKCNYSIFFTKTVMFLTSLGLIATLGVPFLRSVCQIKLNFSKCWETDISIIPWWWWWCFFYSDVKVLLATNNSTDHQYDNKELCYQNVKKQLALRLNVLHHTFVSNNG